MSEQRHFEAVVDDDGWIVEGEYWEWDCDCGGVVHRSRGQGDVSCPECDQPFNAFGQRLRRDWRNNRSNWDEDVSDMDGYEDSYAGEDY